MPRPKLDRTDLKILHKLQEDGRITNVELANYSGISAPPCLRRVRNLEEAGVIRGYHADINPSALGFTITCFALVKLESQKDSDIVRFEEQIGEWTMVRECHLLAGDIDFILKIVARDWEQYQNFLTNQLSAMENVTSVRTSSVVRESKKLAGVPIAV
jgi:DNA-binding Lrp family transcriptional regulator